jgi:drug/metabolite transporter (DMT)-like permease
VPGDRGRERPAVFPVLSLGKLRDVRPRDLAIRFALGAAVSVAAGILGNVFGHRFGGAFLAFPAILPASLTLVQEEEGTRRADRNAIGAVLGAVGMVVFALAGEAGFGRIPGALALLAALAGWIAAAAVLYALLAYVKPDSADRNKDSRRRGRAGEPAGPRERRIERVF